MTNPLNMQSQDKQAWRIEQLKELFPHCVTEHRDAEGKLGHHVDFERLREELDRQLIEPREERYSFTWPGKTEAIQLASEPINKTLRPCKEESVDFAQTENVYIEGDNLEVLKLLQETYLGKVKMIYIDPPYNTGNDFVYDDDFSMSEEEWKESSGEYNEFGHKLVRNTEANGRFHTDWLNMIYPRLKLAKDLLREDGVIFISIDDNEVHNLRKVCDEIFGEQNFVGCILWKKKTNGNNVGLIPPVHDYVIVYARCIQSVRDLGYLLSTEDIQKKYSNPDNDPRGPWKTMDLSANHVGPTFPIINSKTGESFTPSIGRYWVFNKEEVERRIKDGRIIFGKSGTARPVQKVFASERVNNRQPAESWWDKHGMNGDATAEIMGLFGHGKLFTHPKPSKLLCNILEISTDKDSIILDFFSGSATTAHAVMKLNAEDGGNRKYILVQVPEATDTKSEAYQAGYPNICEIGKERIRRAAAKIKEEQGMLADASLDLGFRVYKLADSNMKDVFYLPKELKQQDLLASVDNIKEDRSGLDLLAQVMLDLGLPLSSPIEERDMLGKCVYLVGDSCELAACFDDGMDDALVQAIAALKPFHFVRRDAALHHDTLASNIEQIFEAMSPETKRSIL